MKQRTVLESFIVRPRPVFEISSFDYISFQVITKITLKPGLNIEQILNLIKYKNI
jgi:hypothetical protein